LSKYKILARDQAKVAKVRAVIEGAFDGKVDELQRLLGQPDPNPSDQKYFRGGRQSYEKDLTFRANAVSAQLRMLESMIDLTLTPQKEVDPDEVRAQQARDLIAAIRGQMDPERIAEIEQELDMELGGDDE
jgi:hypothetical protein